MRKATIIMALVVIVVAIFLLKPDLLGSGSDAPSLAVITAGGDTMNVQTNISCTEVQDCIDYVLSQDPGAVDVRALCSGTCTFITKKTPVEVQP